MHACDATSRDIKAVMPAFCHQCSDHMHFSKRAEMPPSKTKFAENAFFCVQENPDMFSPLHGKVNAALGRL